MDNIEFGKRKFKTFFTMKQNFANKLTRKMQNFLPWTTFWREKCGLAYKVPRILFEFCSVGAVAVRYLIRFVNNNAYLCSSET